MESWDGLLPQWSSASDFNPDKLTPSRLPLRGVGSVNHLDRAPVSVAWASSLYRAST